MFWKIALLVLAVAAFIYVTIMLIKSIKEFKSIVTSIKLDESVEDKANEPSEKKE